MKFRGEIIKGELILRIFVEISSYPYESFGLRDLVIIYISLIVVGLYFMLGYDVCRLFDEKYTELSFFLSFE
jgi:hypothetical protein